MTTISSSSIETSEFGEKENRMVELTTKSEDITTTKSPNRKPGGWKSMPFILGNEICEKMATMGAGANLMVFLQKQFHLDQVKATNIMNIWMGCFNFSPLLGAYVSDSYVGRFWTIGFCSFFTLLGLMTLTLIASVPVLLPNPHCITGKTHPNLCEQPNTSQMSVLITALGLLVIGTGGIRPCSLPFGVDQFDATSDKGRKGINTFFNLYYTIITTVLITTQTVIVYVASKSWIWGFGILTSLMLTSIILFFAGIKFYVRVNPEGSVFLSIAQVLVSAFKKRNLLLPRGMQNNLIVFYNPPITETSRSVKLPFTNQYRCLNKGGIILEGEVKADGSPKNKWRLSSIQQIEEVKCVARVLLIWASGIMCIASVSQQSLFSVSQAQKMNRHLGPKFEIPEASIPVIAMITVAIWLPIYDRILLPIIRKRTKIETGITILQRLGIGIVFSILSLLVAGLIERKRQNSGAIHVMWLAPQFILLGFAEAFNLLGQIEFYYKEFPDKMRSVGNSLFSASWGFGGYLSSVLVTIVHNFSGRKGRAPWLTKEINDGRLDYFYYLLAGLGLLNFVYFLMVTPGYRYKSAMRITDADQHDDRDTV